MKKILSSISAFIIVAYFWSALLIFTPYFNWQYANQNGFVKWLLGGEILPTLKAFIWPYYVFFETTNLKVNETAEYWIQKSNALWDGHKYTDPKRAIEYLNNAIKLKPDSAEAYGARGNAYCDHGQYEHAIKDYSDAIRLKPGDAVVYLNRGSGYGSLGQYQHAIEDYSEAIRLKPDLTLAYGGRGLAYLKQGNNNLGCQDIRKACDMGDCSLLQSVNAQGTCR